MTCNVEPKKVNQKSINMKNSRPELEDDYINEFEEEDDFFDESFEDDDPTVYQCMSCGHTTSSDRGGGELLSCGVCCGPLSETTI